MTRFALAIAAVAAFSCVRTSAAQTSDAMTGEARGLLRDLVAIDTSAAGSTTPAAIRVADYLKAAGFPAGDVWVGGASDRLHNVVARLRGRGIGRPVLFLAHLDVVPAARDDWSTDPFTLTEKDGYLYGRGTIDDKQFCATFAAAFARLKREGFVPAGDLILALTSGEETASTEDGNGVLWLLRHQRALVDAAYVINGDAGGGSIAEDGRYLMFGVQAGEKLYADFTLETTHVGGHSSRPVKENPIYRLAHALDRVEALALPLRVSEITRPLLAFLGTTESGARAADLQAAAATPPDEAAIARLAAGDPSLNAQLRTTCVATQLSGGHAPNALPQRARANVNCRILPGDTPAGVKAALEAAIADPAVAVTQTAGPREPAAVRLDPRVMSTIAEAADAVWRGVPVLPVLEVGATDGFHFRNLGIDVYGVNHFQREEDARAHGRDERIGVKQFDETVRFCYELAKRAGR